MYDLYDVTKENLIELSADAPDDDDNQAFMESIMYVGFQR